MFKGDRTEFDSNSPLRRLEIQTELIFLGGLETEGETSTQRFD
jgi:hypothetical protein